MSTIIVSPDDVQVETHETQANPIASAPSSPDAVIRSFNEGGAREFLSQNKWPSGLQDTFVKNLPSIAFRYFICDDSGSMSTPDGSFIYGDTDSDKKIIDCSRWVELVHTLKFHAALSRAVKTPCEFRLLNSGSPQLVGMMDTADNQRYTRLVGLLEGSPINGTPLCRHITQVVHEIRTQESQLRASGQKALVVIATDGEASDGDVAVAMRPLKSLPVWVILRLCTDQRNVVTYWNRVDAELELDMDVIDDIVGEAKEIHEYNPWLTYGEPLQRLREFGLSVKELDLLDERKLSYEEVRKVASLIYGGSVENYPHPAVDMKGFLAAIEHQNSQLGKVWCPYNKKARDWMDVSALRAFKFYTPPVNTAMNGGKKRGDDGCCVIA